MGSEEMMRKCGDTSRAQEELSGDKKKTDVFIGCKEMYRIHSYLGANGVEIGAKGTYMISHIFKALGL